MAIKIPQTNVELLPIGKYVARIDNIVLQPEGIYGPQLLWRFVIQGDHEGTVVPGWTEPTYSPKSKLYHWDRAAKGGIQIPRDQEFSSDEIVGNIVVVFVTQQSGKNGIYNRVEDLQSYNPRAAKATEDDELPF